MISLIDIMNVSILKQRRKSWTIQHLDQSLLASMSLQRTLHSVSCDIKYIYLDHLDNEESSQEAQGYAHSYLLNLYLGEEFVQLCNNASCELSENKSTLRQVVHAEHGIGFENLVEYCYSKTFLFSENCVSVSSHDKRALDLTFYAINKYVDDNDFKSKILGDLEIARTAFPIPLLTSSQIEATNQYFAKPFNEKYDSNTAPSTYFAMDQFENQTISEKLSSMITTSKTENLHAPAQETGLFTNMQHELKELHPSDLECLFYNEVGDGQSTTAVAVTSSANDFDRKAEAKVTICKEEHINNNLLFNVSSVGECCGQTFAAKSQFGKHIFYEHCIVMGNCMLCSSVEPIDSLMKHYESAHNMSPLSSLNDSVSWNIEIKENAPLTSSTKDLWKQLVTCNGCSVTMSLKSYLDHLFQQYRSLYNDFEISASTTKSIHKLFQCLWFKCQLCDENGAGAGAKPVRLYSLVKRHVQRYHLTTSPKDEKIFCSNCCKMILKINFKKHMEQHQRKACPFAQDEKVTCNICCKEVSKSQLRHHRRSHLSRFSCPVCNKVFNRKDNLKTHLRLHTHEKRFNCSVCGKAFNQKVELHQHSKQHRNMA